MLRLAVIISLTLLTVFGCKKAADQELDLAGQWSYQLDPEEIGEKEQWYTTDFLDSIVLPAALRDHGIGSIPDLNTQWTGSIYDSSWFFNPAMEKYRQEGDVKFPFWLTPVKRYVGMAWYQKTISIPSAWEGQDVVVFLERPHWQTKVWLDTLQLGEDNSLSTPHQFVIPAEVVSAGSHRLTIKVDNAIRDLDPGINSHSIS